MTKLLSELSLLLTGRGVCYSLAKHNRFDKTDWTNYRTPTGQSTLLAVLKWMFLASRCWNGCFSRFAKRSLGSLVTNFSRMLREDSLARAFWIGKARARQWNH